MARLASKKATGEEPYDHAQRPPEQHGGLHLHLTGDLRVLFALSELAGIASADGILVVTTPRGPRPLSAKELQERLVSQRTEDAFALPQDRERRAWLAFFPLWACEAALKEGEWPGVPVLEVQDEETDKTAQGLALLRKAISEAPDEAVTTAWLMANAGKTMNEAMKLLCRACTARNVGIVLRDFGPGVGIWSTGRHAYGKRWTVAREPGSENVDPGLALDQGNAAKPRPR